MDKIEQSLGLIRLLAGSTKAPAAMLSFGKDSMALAGLIRSALAGRTERFPLPVIYYRDPWFPAKHVFADETARAWGMEVHDYPPLMVGVKTNRDMIELVARYSFGIQGIDIPKNVCQPQDYPRRKFICGLNDWLSQPRSVAVHYPWDLVFIGHKSSDIDQFEGVVPLKHDAVMAAGVMIGFPLRHWTDADVWDYLETNHIKVQETRYKDRRELPDRWYNNDYLHACTACIDPREKAKEVFCPKLKRNVPNRGELVPVLDQRPTYVERRVAA